MNLLVPLDPFVVPPSLRNVLHQMIRLVIWSIGVQVAQLASQVIAWKPEDNDELKKAVEDWISDSDYAMETYGDSIKNWDTSEITVGDCSCDCFELSASQLPLHHTCSITLQTPSGPH